MKRLPSILFLILALAATLHAQERPDMEARLKQVLEKYPQADLDQDGKLTRKELQTYMDTRRAPRPRPTHANITYGDHQRQRFDLYLAPREEGDAPNPLVIYIHGGGFRGGTKNGISPGSIAAYHEAGISVAAIEYRLSDVGPYPIMMEDAARCLQTIRHRADEWHIDPERIGCYGGSAGAGISLWLGFHDDLADPDSDDPIARQSTRILAAGISNGQSTYDMRTFAEWFGVPDLKPHAALVTFYAVDKAEDWNSDRVKELMTDASAMTHLSKDDVPVYATYGKGNVPVDASTPEGVWVHHVLLGLKHQEAMKKLDLECVVRSPEHKDGDPYGSMEKFFIDKLKPVGKQALAPPDSDR